MRGKVYWERLWYDVGPKIAYGAKVVFGIKFGSVGFSSLGECGSFIALKVIKDM